MESPRFYAKSFAWKGLYGSPNESGTELKNARLGKDGHGIISFEFIEKNSCERVEDQAASIKRASSALFWK